jgi:hypothetical protein
MATFIRLPGEKNLVVLINLDQIVAVQQSEGGTRFVGVDGKEILSAMKFEDVAKMLANVGMVRLVK